MNYSNLNFLVHIIYCLLPQYCSCLNTNQEILLLEIVPSINTIRKSLFQEYLQTIKCLMHVNSIQKDDDHQLPMNDDKLMIFINPNIHLNLLYFSNVHLLYPFRTYVMLNATYLIIQISLMNIFHSLSYILLSTNSISHFLLLYVELLSHLLPSYKLNWLLI